MREKADRLMDVCGRRSVAEQTFCVANRFMSFTVLMDVDQTYSFVSLWDESWAHEENQSRGIEQ